jgi:hypothetical protein
LVVKSSYSLSLHHLTDKKIYEDAKKHGQVIIISKDADFLEVINRLGSPPKLINIKTGCNKFRILKYDNPKRTAAPQFCFFWKQPGISIMH